MLQPTIKHFSYISFNEFSFFKSMYIVVGWLRGPRAWPSWHAFGKYFFRAFSLYEAWIFVVITQQLSDFIEF